jgi:tRNA(fMet)-specific endonuclease VapC
MLDTDIASYAIKRRSQFIQEKLSLLDPTRVCVSVVTKAELLYGLKGLPREHHLHVSVRQFLKIVQVLPWDSDSAGFYADIRHALTTSGQLVGELDMMIAAHSLSVNAVLVTNNTRHYKRMPVPLMLENWAETKPRQGPGSRN